MQIQMRVVVPFAAKSPKTRLTSVLTTAERSAFARSMLADVLCAIVEAGHEPTIVSTGPLDLVDLDLPGEVGSSTSIVVDDRPLTAAVNARLPMNTECDVDAVGVVMSDLALATPDALEELFSAAADVVIAPGRAGGTNALVVRHPSFHVDYHGGSYLDHREIAREVEATIETLDSFRLATDIDEPEDLVEILIHGHKTDRAPTCLREFDFQLDDGEGRVAVVRKKGTARM